jgi:hypothetical protein
MRRVPLLGRAQSSFSVTLSNLTKINLWIPWSQLLTSQIRYYLASAGYDAEARVRWPVREEDCDETTDMRCRAHALWRRMFAEPLGANRRASQTGPRRADFQYEDEHIGHGRGWCVKPGEVRDLVIQQRFTDKDAKTEELHALVTLTQAPTTTIRGVVVLGYKHFEQGWRLQWAKPNASYSFERNF